MFGYRTPAKSTLKTSEHTTTPEKLTKAGPSQGSQVRRSIGEWESGLVEKRPKSPAPSSVTAPVPKPKSKATSCQETKVTARRDSTEAPGGSPKGKVYASKTAEARACLNRAKLYLSNSRNLKTDIKAGVTQAIERLYQLVKEAESTKGEGEVKNAGKQKQMDDNVRQEESKDEDDGRKNEKESELIEKLTEHGRLMKENNEKMEVLKGVIEKQSQALERTTYAGVAAGNTSRQVPDRAALHSVVVTSKDVEETGEEVLVQLREAINAKDGWVKVERVRKAKDHKIIVGCSTEAERQKVKERLKRAGDRLNVEDVVNKDPLLILRGVFRYNSDEDIISALRNQNRDIFDGLGKEDDRLEIRFRKRARNPLVCHVIMRVSPTIWSKAVRAEELYVDLQRIEVADHSPLVQCSLCLGYGHGRRFCKETVVKCSHCGGDHMKTECANWLASAPPSCCNCTRAKLDTTEHNAFSQECPIRRQWDALARASIAYC